MRAKARIKFRLPHRRALPAPRPAEAARTKSSLLLSRTGVMPPPCVPARPTTARKSPRPAANPARTTPPEGLKNPWSRTATAPSTARPWSIPPPLIASKSNPPHPRQRGSKRGSSQPRRGINTHGRRAPPRASAHGSITPHPKTAPSLQTEVGIQRRISEQPPVFASIPRLAVGCA